MSVINSFTQHTINLTRKALRLGSDFVHPVHDDTPDEPDYLSNADVPVETNIALPHSDDWDDGHLTVTDIDPATGLLTTSTEGNPSLDEGTSIYDLYADRAERMGDEPLYTYKSGNDWVTVTANEFLADVRAVAKGLIHYGLKKGDAVAFMCRTSYDWDLTDAAIMACGGVLATIYDTDSAEQIRNIVNNSDARLLIVQDTDMRKKADGSVEECPSLEHIITIETGGLDEIKAYGTTVSDEELDERIDSVKKTDLCSIVYTSGSTAAPKGVEMTHEHYCQTALNLPAYMPDLLHDKKNTILLFLPQAHLEKVYNAASQKAGHGPKGVVFASAVVAAQNYMKEVSANGKAGALTRTRRAAFDPIVYSSLREVLGGRAKWIVAGGAPLDPELLAFFRGAGVPVYEGYGLTETTAPCAFNPLGTPFHAGSVGIAFPGFSLRIAEDGEIQVKGRAKNVSPGPIEEVIQRCEFVSQALVLGDKRPFISALVTLDEKSLRPWLAAKGLDENMSLEDAARNASMKVIRPKVIKRYSTLLNTQMYTKKK
ncbi:MAG: AMP-binding protein [Bifidobacterium longum]|nr:AMP-binding protein [Bifidobacterium longum]